MSTPTIRCTLCASEFVEEDVAGRHGCPVCGSQGTPCAIADDVSVTINWHELRVLGIWASNWARDICKDPQSRAVACAILDRLQTQHPGRAPLTLDGEFAQLREHFPGVQIFDRGKPREQE